ncbi:MAG: PKD domain-containing protein [Myxococcota bacterium]|nr:PKD domain-containing protein [Myxococcota bacterium]
MRFFILALCISFSGPVYGQQQITGPNGQTYRVDGRGHGGLVGPSPYEGWPQLCVRVCNNDCNLACDVDSIYSAAGVAPTQTDGLQGLQMATVQLAGLQVSRHIWIPAAGPQNADGFVVYFDELFNPTNAPITVNIRLGTVASGRGQINDANARVWRTQSDDSILEIRDRWFLVDDDQAFGGRPSLAVLTHGAGARQALGSIQQAAFDNDQAGQLNWTFDQHTIPAGSRSAFISVLSLNATRTDALDEIESLIRMRDVDVLFATSAERRRAVQNFDIDPDNASPVANAGGPYTTDEGLPIDLSGVFSYDAENVQLQYSWDLTDDGVDNFGDALTANARAQFSDDGIYTVRLRVDDGTGKFDIDNARIQVRNVNPRIDAISTSSPVQEGELIDFEIDASDPGADRLTYEFDWDGDGQFDTDPSPDNRAQYRHQGDGELNGIVRVRDDDGGFVDGPFSVSILNAPPRINQIVAPPGIAEGATFEIRVIAEDGGNDPLIFSYDIDEDGRNDFSGLDLDRIEVAYQDDGLYVVRVQVCDDQNACSTGEVPVNVGNIRPRILDVTATTPIVEGQSSRIVVNAVDVVGDPLLYAFDIDNDGDYSDDVENQLQSALTIPFADDGIYFVGVRVDDGDGGIVTDVVRIEVTNAPPTAEIRGPVSTRQGLQEQFTCQGSDVGDDRLRYDWDLDGDDLYEVSRGQAQITHSFRAVGSLTIRCRVSDGDGGFAFAEHQVFVSNERPQLDIEVASPQNEGTEVIIRAFGSDAGGDTLAYSYDIDGDGEIDYGPTDEAIIRHTYPNQGFFTVRAWADDGIDQIDASAQIRISNVDPTVRLSIQSPVNEGDEVAVTAEVSDPGADLITLRWDLDGDGEPEPDRSDTVEDGLVEQRFLTSDDGRYDVTVWADDGDGGEISVAQALIIENVAPQFPDGYQPPAAVEGRPYNRAIPANDVAGQNDPIRYSLLDPPEGVEIEENTGLLLWTPTYADFLNRPVVLRVRIDDGDGGTTQRAIPFDVLPTDEDDDGIPDSYEINACSADGVCLDPTNPDDADADPDMDGRSNRQEWTDETDPYAYEGPEPTELLFPEDEDRVNTLSPQLVARRVQDNQGNAIFIEFELFDTDQPTMPIVSSGRVLQPVDGDTRWMIPEGLLDEDVWYWWRARAVTARLNTPWTSLFVFRTNSENSAPTTPQLLGPPDGSSLGDLRPTLRATVATDADEDYLRYVFRIYGPNGEIFTTGAGEPIDGEIHFRTPALIENTTMTWDVVAIDEASAESAPSESWSIYVDTENSAPSTPRFLRPIDAEVIGTVSPEFAVTPSEDEDGDTVTYLFTIHSQDGELVLASEAIADSGDEEIIWQPDFELDEDHEYTASIYAQDERGAVSSEDSVTFFVSTENDPPSIPMPLSPRNASEVFGDDAILIWTDAIDPEGAVVNYVVELCAGEMCVRSEPQTEVSISMANIVQDGETYSWRVEAIDADGLSSGLSEPWQFTISGTSTSSDAGDSGCSCHVGDAPKPPNILTLLLVLIGLVGLRFRKV